MWNPNSDNRKADDVPIAETSDQQQLNILDNRNLALGLANQQRNIAGNGKTLTIKNLEGESSCSNYGGGGDYTADNSSVSCGGGVDSGFLSGPQLVDDYDTQEESSHGGRAIPSVTLNIVDKQPFTEDYQDSGCIEEDLVEEEHHQQLQHRQQKPSITTTVATPQIQQRTIVATTADDVVESEEEDQMLLDSGVVTEFAESFCKLSLKNPSQQMNNLGAASQRKSQNASSSTNKNTNATEPWEKYYQQNNEGETQLHIACSTGYADVVAVLIRMAPDPCLFNIQNDEAQTGLHLAVLYGQPKILRMLLIAGAKATTRDRNGNTPLHLACMNGDLQCAKALTLEIAASEINEAHRSYGHLSSDKRTSYLNLPRHLPADLELRNYDGERCVHLAAQGGYIDILSHLVRSGADINAREGRSGRTPLHIAIEGRNESLAKYILEECEKLNLETETYSGLTAYQVACILNYSTMQNNLEQRGAEPLIPPDSDYESSDVETDVDDMQMFDRFGDPRYFANYNGGNPINVA